jgi:MFS family permease
MPTPHPFSIPNFRYLWLSRLCSNLSQNAMMLIVGWQAYNLAREDYGIAASAGILGLLGLLQFVPLFILTPLVGWVADRHDRRWIARMVVAVQLLIAMALAALTWTGHISLYALYGISIAIGACRAFLGPALGALTANLVPAKSLPRAIALSTIAWQVGGIVGPAIAGPLYAIGPSLPYITCGGLYALSFAALMRIGKVPRSQIDKSKGPFRQIGDGMAYVWTNKLVLGTISLDLMVMFLAGAQAMIPVFARDILHAGEAGLSLLAVAPALGAALVATWFAFRPLSNNVGNKMLAAMAVFGLATAGFGLSPYLPLSMACLALCGATDMFGVFVRTTLIQLHTPDEKRGRVGAVSQMTISASNELGDAFTGALALFLGPIAAIVAGGIGAIFITGFWSRIFPQISAAKNFDHPADMKSATLE